MAEVVKMQPDDRLDVARAPLATAISVPLTALDGTSFTFGALTKLPATLTRYFRFINS